ncbi:spherulation-specific family 4 protein [Actinocrispum wychmicini]|uniref:Spherulation-specific family 4 protein n=1 Tax=Actinocrispum wychmicini TaxID=1213861 RepID=A0A4R2JU62_9PSEU|nr:spherulation-specific family 4 protein [Actinocrispum wychmicini]TCO60549.1 spherulation-specific family 4 protein [Actinocrispum wychmicini]
MRTPLRWLRAVGIGAAVCVVVVTSQADAAACGNNSQRLGIPAYWGTEGTGPGLWRRLANEAPNASLAIVGIQASGPGPVLLPEVKRVVDRTRSSGVRLLSYVDTSYTNRPVDTVLADIANAFIWYGTDGIFLDQAANTCDKLGYYQALHDYVKSIRPNALVVLNPGTNTDECYTKVSDVLVDFEGTYDTYVTWSPSDWVRAYPAKRFWHLVFGTSCASQMRDVIKKSRQRNAGYVFVTDTALPNPWNALPAYWRSELAALGSSR